MFHWEFGTFFDGDRNVKQWVIIKKDPKNSLYMAFYMRGQWNSISDLTAKLPRLDGFREKLRRSTKRRRLPDLAKLLAHAKANGYVPGSGAI